MPRGFILQPTYRIESGRPIVLLYGRAEGGRSFLVRDTRETPHFFVRRADVERAREIGANAVEDGRERVTLAGDPVARVDLRKPQDCPPLRDRLVAEGVPCYEADVRFAYRYLIDRGIRGSVDIRGTARPGDGRGRRIPTTRRSGRATGGPSPGCSPSTSRRIRVPSGCCRSACTAAVPRRSCC